jgi:tRNA dimethylallyltransferase
MRRCRTTIGLEYKGISRELTGRKPARNNGGLQEQAGAPLPKLTGTPGTVWLLAGPTATGKSAVAQWIAERCGAAILSADSMLVYRGMDIGTAKPSLAERGNVPYFGLDCVSPAEPFSVGDWLAHAQRGLASLDASRPVIVAGGTGLYFRALISGLDGAPAVPERRAYWKEFYTREGLEGLWRALETFGDAAALAPGDRNNPRRCIRALERAEQQAAKGDAAPPAATWSAGGTPVVPVLCLPRDQLHARIERRARRMFEDGLMDEAVALRARGALSATARQAIGYAEALALADGRMTEEAALERVVIRTRQLAKRQMTWFRHQFNVHWIEITGDMPVPQVAGRVLEAWRQHGATPIQPFT